LSLRLRLTLFYGALLAVVLTLVGVAVYVALRSSVRATLDSALRDATSLAVSQLSGDEGKPKFSDPETDAFQSRLPSTTALVVYDRNGQITDRIGPRRVQARLEPGYQTVADTRVYTERLADGGWVQALRGEAETLEVLGRVQGVLFIALPLLLLLGLGGGYLIADRALEPVDHVSKLADTIAGSGRYQARVPEAPGRDEMARLTRTVNAMLARLESTIDRERAFALAAAHELRTPLTVLRGRASWLLKRRRTGEEYERAAEEMLETSAEMSELVDRLLTLARSQQPLQRVPVNLGDLTQGVAETVQPQAESRGITVHLESGDARLHGDPQALRLALGNLLGNAIKYGRAGGNVWLRTFAQDDAVVLEVADDGEGIPDADLERLRQPFQRGLGLQAVSGTGLGLALVAAVVEQHGGRLGLGRAEQGGLLARMTLPQG
jgi:signal transduction histidine kinase